MNVDVDSLHHYALSTCENENSLKIPRTYSLAIQRLKDPEKRTKEQGSLCQLKIIQQLLEKCEDVTAAYYPTYENELLFGYLFEYLKIPKSSYKIAYLNRLSFFNKDKFTPLQACSAVTETLFQTSHRSNLFTKMAEIYAKAHLAYLAPKGNFDLQIHEFPFLAKICQRHIQIRQAKKQEFYRLEFICHRQGKDYVFISDESWDQKDLAEHNLRMCIKLPDFVVASVTHEKVVELPPPLYDLSSLQIKAHQKYELSASYTYKVVKMLCEREFLSNALTYSRDMPMDYWNKISKVVKELNDYKRYKGYIRELKLARFNPVHAKEVEIFEPTGIFSGAYCPFTLKYSEYLIYFLITSRILESVSAESRKTKTTVTLNGGYVPFSLKASKNEVLGWRQVHWIMSEDKQERFCDLSVFDPSDVIKGNQFSIRTYSKEITLHCESSLLQEIEDEYSIDATDENQSNYQLTHLNSVDRLIKLGFVENQDAELVPTLKGLELFGLIKTSRISSTSFLKTAKSYLDDFKKGKITLLELENKQESWLKLMLDELQKIESPANKGVLYCPKCKDYSVYIKKDAAECQSLSCDWLLARNTFGIRLSKNEVIDLVQLQRTVKLRTIPLGDRNIKASFVLNAEFAIDLLPRKKSKKGGDAIL
ncbi:DNA topoisomerase [Myroides sp. LJL119]